jgi:hypothetical protein
MLAALFRTLVLLPLLTLLVVVFLIRFSFALREGAT